MLALLASAAAEAPPMRIGTYAYPAFDRRVALTPLADYLSDQLNRRVEIVIVESPDALQTAIRHGNVELAVTNLATFLAVESDKRVKPVAVLSVPASTLDRYRGILAARSQSGIRVLSDVVGKESNIRYVEVLPGSTSGALIQRKEMDRVGISWRNFAELSAAGTHERALDLLVAGQADLAASAEEPFLRLRALDPVAFASIALLWRSDPLPPGPIVCVVSVSTPCDDIRRLLLARTQRTADVAGSLAAGWAETTGARSFKAVKGMYREFVRR